MTRTTKHWTFGTFGTVGLLAACLVLSPAVSCSRGEKPAEPQVTQEKAAPEEAHDPSLVTLTAEAQARGRITAAPVEAKALDPEMETTGQVGFDEDRVAHVSPRIAGRITSVRVTLGQRVSQGETLAVLDSVELGRAKADYQQAKAREELTSETYERERKLAADKISSEQEVLTARAAHLEAAAELRRAEQTLHLFGLSDRQVRSGQTGETGSSLSPVSSPFNGTIVEKEASIGEMVSPERKLFTVADLGRVWIWIDVFEKDLARVHLDDGVAVTVDAYPGETFAGKVTFLGGGVDAGTRTVRARLVVDNRDGRLRPGLFARIRLSDPHGKPAEGTAVPVVAESALQREGDGFVVFVVGGERRYHKRPVRTGRRAGGLIEILDGVKPGERVVVEGAFLLASEAAKETLGEGED